MHKCINPKEIYSPRDAVKNVEVIYDDPNGVSIAKLIWLDRIVIGIRWNLSFREEQDPEKMSGKVICKGMPLSRGFPTCFILPDGLLDKNSEITKMQGIQKNS